MTGAYIRGKGSMVDLVYKPITLGYEKLTCIINNLFIETCSIVPFTLFLRKSVVTMRFTQIAALLSMSAIACAQLTYNITQANAPGNRDKYHCLYASHPLGSRYKLGLPFIRAVQDIS